MIVNGGIAFRQFLIDQKLPEQKAPKKAQSQQPKQSLSIGIPRQSLGTSKNLTTNLVNVK